MEMLVLYETDRIIAENGYKGIFKYLYSGYLEIKRLLLLPSVLFSFHYNDFSIKQQKKRIRRIKAVKVIIFILVLTVFVALCYALSSFLPFFVALITALALSFLSVPIIGVFVQALNNFIEEKVGPSKLTYPLSESQLDKMRDTYFILSGEKLMAAVNEFVSHKDDVQDLFANPYHYHDGLFIKARIQMLLEILYLRTAERRMKDAQDLLIDFLYALYTRFDSVILQELMTNHSLNEDISEIKKKDILQFYFTINDTMFKKSYPKDRLARIKNQNELVKFLFVIEKEKEGFSWENCLNIIEERKFGTISAQLLINHFMKITGFVPFNIFGKYLSSGELNDVKKALSSTSGRDVLLKELEEKEIPREISLLYIRSAFLASEIYAILVDTENPIEFRLYSLFTLSRHSCPAMALRALIFDGMNTNISIMESSHYDKPVVDKALANDLIKESKKYIENIKKQKPDKRNDFFNAVNTEITFTAMAVIAHKNNKKVDIVDFLKQLKYTFGNGKEVEMILSLSESGDFESFGIPLKNTKKYFESLNKIIEEVKFSLDLFDE